jgi:hypothetical protein
MKRHIVVIFSLPTAAVLLWHANLQVAFAQEGEMSAKADPAGQSVAQSTDKGRLFPKPVSGSPLLITSEVEQKVIERFKGGYAKLGRPRIALLLNRELIKDVTVATTNLVTATSVQSNAGTTVANTTVTVTVTPDKFVDEHTGQAIDRDKAYIRDKQILFNVERSFSAPLRSGGAALVDIPAAVLLLPDKPEQDPSGMGTQGRKEREALMKTADEAVQILITTQPIVVFRGLTTNLIRDIPDVQAKAIRLSDSRILGQATASDFIGSNSRTFRLLRMVGRDEIVKATSLALMDDIMMGLAFEPEQSLAMVPPTQTIIADGQSESQPPPQVSPPHSPTLNTNTPAEPPPPSFEETNSIVAAETNKSSPTDVPGEIAGRKSGRPTVRAPVTTPSTNLPSLQETSSQGSSKPVTAVPNPTGGDTPTIAQGGEVADCKSRLDSVGAQLNQPTAGAVSKPVSQSEVSGRLPVLGTTNLLTMEALRDMVRKTLGEM